MESKIKPESCFKRCHNFAKMWVLRLRAPQRHSNVRTLGRIGCEQIFRQVDKTSRDEKMFCYQHFGGLRLTADSTANSECKGKSSG